MEKIRDDDSAAQEALDATKQYLETMGRLRSAVILAYSAPGWETEDVSTGVLPISSYSNLDPARPANQECFIVLQQAVAKATLQYMN